MAQWMGSQIVEGVAMLVVGRHRGGAARQAVSGSVSAVCARRAFRPVER
ncbi:universal stress protein [Allokutzneria sp. NRRL B-24872]|nr:universal stress protein [Allokutzneria sp. NRRL B-24872]